MWSASPLSSSSLYSLLRWGQNVVSLVVVFRWSEPEKILLGRGAGIWIKSIDELPPLYLSFLLSTWACLIFFLLSSCRLSRARLEWSPYLPNWSDQPDQPWRRFHWLCSLRCQQEESITLCHWAKQSQSELNSRVLDGDEWESKDQSSDERTVLLDKVRVKTQWEVDYLQRRNVLDVGKTSQERARTLRKIMRKRK